jgi:hypothetical protein
MLVGSSLGWVLNIVLEVQNFVEIKILDPNCEIDSC